jgi:hypothetical protein
MREGDIPMAVVKIDPGGGAGIYAETMRTDMPQGFGIPDFNGTGHGNPRVVGMGAVKFALENNPAVEVDKRLSFGTFPTRYTLTGLLVIFADKGIADGVKVLGVHSHSLFSLHGRKPPQLLIIIIIGTLRPKARERNQDPPKKAKAK